MEMFHGALLIGGMALDDLEGEIEGEPDGETAQWRGRFPLDRTRIHCLQLGRTYRLETADGRAAQVVVSRMEEPVGHLQLLVEFDGKTPLIETRWQRIPR
jgi:hypothetical protein